MAKSDKAEYLNLIKIWTRFNTKPSKNRKKEAWEFLKVNLVNTEQYWDNLDELILFKGFSEVALELNEKSRFIEITASSIKSGTQLQPKMLNVVSSAPLTVLAHAISLFFDLTVSIDVMPLNFEKDHTIALFSEKSKADLSNLYYENQNLTALHFYKQRNTELWEFETPTLQQKFRGDYTGESLNHNQYYSLEKEKTISIIFQKAYSAIVATNDGVTEVAQQDLTKKNNEHAFDKKTKAKSPF